MARILLVEDEPDLALLVVQGLVEVGHEVEHVDRGDAGLERALQGYHHLAIVDRILPGLDGLTLVRTLRERNSTIPVLFLSSLGALHERIEGLNAGGDDYLPKPFAFSELLARIEALLRRIPAFDVVHVLKVGDVEMDVITRQVKRAGRRVNLLPREFALLEYLMRHAGQLMTRTMLLEGVWNYRFDPKTNIVETHISRLRSKIGHDMITTVRNSGYLMRATSSTMPHGDIPEDMPAKRAG